ncbi:MAG: type I restriction endonuclease subunit R, partial [Selenomonadaceae bacterium]|nr:type I restriction endonuclease subunit R [Selenomonadaceae bacterium]
VPYRNEADSFRPDITIFVNGLPLAFVEVKVPDNKQGIQAEHRRMSERFSQEKYRRFANITQLMIFSNNSEYDDDEIVPLEGAFYAKSDYRQLFFNRFREEDAEIFNNLAPLGEITEMEILKDTNYLSIRSTPEYETNKNPLSPTNKILTSLLSRERFMFILRYGFAYVKDSHDGGITTIQKHVMRYQQIFAEFKIKKMLDEGGKRGVIWHTQGSGKTALAYHSVKFLTDYYQRKNYSTQFYFIVDRLELLQQAANEFRKRGLEVIEVNSRENFIAAIQRAGNASTTGKLSITVVNIQKFSDESVAKEPKFNVNVQRIYFIDEAHRGYKWDGSFLARLMKSDREAVMIALTGTPLIGEYKTRDIFGNYIHSYYYNQSIADGYTLRLIREGIKTEYRLKLQAALSNLEKQVAKGTLDKDKIYSHENYVSPLVEYIEHDFEQSRKRLNDETIGAMIACDSSEQAKAIYDKLNEHGKFSAELVLSTVGYSDKELDDKRTNFKQGNVDILVVFKMLLTGFDAPRLKKLYLGRKIKEHNLLQALTRVNRPYGKMRYGYVVDFADIQAEFDKTNQAYLNELREELGDEFGMYKKIFKSQEEIADDLAFVKDKLFQFDTDNAEGFRKQIQTIEDKKIILELRRAIETYKECYNLAEQYGYSNLQFDIKKISDLSKVVNQRVQMLNLKAAWNNTDDMTALISLAVDDVEFSFKKISEQELGIKVEFLKVRRETCIEFDINADKKDPEYITLLEELRRILEQHNIEEMTAAQMQIEQQELDALRKKIHDLNAKNDRLTAKYSGDKKFMRIHKRLSSQFSSPTMLHKLLIELKQTI